MIAIDESNVSREILKEKMRRKKLEIITTAGVAKGKRS